MQVIKESSQNGLNELLKLINTTKDAMILLEHKQHSSEVYKSLQLIKMELLLRWIKTLCKGLLIC